MLTKIVIFLACFLCIKGSNVDLKALIEIEGIEYYISPTVLNAEQSLQLCNDIGKSLAAFETEAEYEAVRNHLLVEGLGSNNYWTSGRKLINLYHWTNTGQFIDYTAWFQPNPDCAASSSCCVAINANQGWLDAGCTAAYYFICE